MTVRHKPMAAWLLLTFTLPTKRASQRVEVWRKLQRYGTVQLGNSGYLLPIAAGNEERFQWLARTIRKYGGDASVVRVESIDNLSTPQLKARFSEARAREYQQLIQEIKGLTGAEAERVSGIRLNRLRNRFQEIVEVDFFDSPLQARVRELLEQASVSSAVKPGRARIQPRASAQDSGCVACSRTLAEFDVFCTTEVSLGRVAEPYHHQNRKNK